MFENTKQAFSQTLKSGYPFSWKFFPKILIIAQDTFLLSINPCKQMSKGSVPCRYPSSYSLFVTLNKIGNIRINYLSTVSFIICL